MTAEVEPTRCFKHTGRWYGSGVWCECGGQECGYCGSLLLATVTDKTFDDTPLVSIDEREYDRLLAIEAAARSLSDRRTLDSDGFRVSQKEMKALDASLEPQR